MTISSNNFDEFVMNYHSFFVVQNIDALRFHFQNDFDVHANVWKEFSWRIFFMLNSMFEQKNLKEFQRIMNEYVILHLKKAYWIEIKHVQILSAAESFGLFGFWAFRLFGFLTFCKGETSNDDFSSRRFFNTFC